MPADVDETPEPGERPLALVRRLAAVKARAVDGDPVLAADTIVEVDGEILGKPVDEADARRMLRRLSARSHRVHTGVALRAGDRLEVQSVTTIVTFVPLLPSAIDWYLATGEPFDKAGAYAIQGAGGVFVEADPGQRQQRRRPPDDHRRPDAPATSAAGSSEHPSVCSGASLPQALGRPQTLGSVGPR